MKAWVASISLHLLLFSLLFFSLTPFLNREQGGINKKTTIKAYIVEIKPATQPVVATSLSSDSIKKLPSEKKELRQKKRIPLSPITTQPQQLGGNNDLLALLHQQILKHLHYPSAANWLHLTGNTTVTFLLLPTGQIQELRIAQSSGSPLLDNTVITAVTNSQPFLLNHTDQKTLPQYLKNTVEFKR